MFFFFFGGGVARHPDTSTAACISAFQHHSFVDRTVGMTTSPSTNQNWPILLRTKCRYSQAPSHRTQRDGGERLSEWDLLRGRQLFDQYDKNGNGFLSRAELQNVIQDMEEEGYLLREGEEETLDSLLTVLDTNHDGKISWAEFERGLNGEAVDSQGKRISRALRWRCLSASEARTRSDELYSLAQKMQMKLGMLDDSSEANAAERQELKAEILRISQLANRFSVLAQGKSSTSQLQSNDRDASHGSNNSDNNSNLQAELKGRRRARRPAPRGDDIRFFEWDVEEPSTCVKIVSMNDTLSLSLALLLGTVCGFLMLLLLNVVALLHYPGVFGCQKDRMKTGRLMTKTKKQQN